MITYSMCVSAAYGGLVHPGGGESADAFILLFFPVSISVRCCSVVFGCLVSNRISPVHPLQAGVGPGRRHLLVSAADHH